MSKLLEILNDIASGSNTYVQEDDDCEITYVPGSITKEIIDELSYGEIMALLMDPEGLVPCVSNITLCQGSPELRKDFIEWAVEKRYLSRDSATRYYQAIRNGETFSRFYLPGRENYSLFTNYVNMVKEKGFKYKQGILPKIDYEASSLYNAEEMVCAVLAEYIKEQYPEGLITDLVEYLLPNILDYEFENDFEIEECKIDITPELLYRLGERGQAYNERAPKLLQYIKDELLV